MDFVFKDISIGRLLYNLVWRLKTFDSKFKPALKVSISYLWISSLRVFRKQEVHLITKRDWIQATTIRNITRTKEAKNGNRRRKKASLNFSFPRPGL